MIYSKTCEYAIRSLGYFVDRGKDAWVTVETISRQTGVPGPYIAKIFQCLVQKNILLSRRGARGGYSLRMDPSKLTLIQVIKALDDIEKSPFSNCIMGLHQCNDRNPCPLHLIWMDAKERMLTKLSHHTVSDIACLVDKFESGRCDRVTLSEGMRAIFAG